MAKSSGDRESGEAKALSPDGHDGPFGSGDAVVKWLVAWVAGVFLSLLVLASIVAFGPWVLPGAGGTGSTIGSATARAAAGQDQPNVLPFAVQQVANLGLWAGWLGAAWLLIGDRWPSFARAIRLTSGHQSVRTQIGDLVVGVGVGLLSQFGLLWVLYRVLAPWIDTESVDDAAQALVDRASSPLGVVALCLVAGLGAPIVEEVFFRGVLFEAFDSWVGRVVAIVASSVIFAATHFQLVQFAGLLAFGLVLAALVHFTDRLGPAIWAHIAFNVATLVVLLS